MCATSCSGTRAYRYGVMRDNVIGLRVVLPDGRLVRTRRRPNKSSAGYDLTRLFIGSEGTLGVITEVTIKLRNIPDNLSVALVTFDDVSKAAAMVQDLFRSGILLHRLELMDKTAMTAANAYNKMDLPNADTLIIEFAGSQSTVAEHSAVVSSFATKNGALVYRLAQDQEEYNAIWALRRNALWSAMLHRPDVDPADLSILNTDTVVPPSRLVEALTRTQELKKEFGLEFQIVAHVGDGNNHVNIPLRKGDKDELARAKAFAEKIAKLAIDFDGSCTGEHGIGIGKRELLELEVGKEAVQVMRAFALGSTFLGTAAILWGIRSRSGLNETALDRVAHAFKQALPDLEMSFDPQDILSHSTDVSSNLPQSKPHVVVYPTSEDEVSQILKMCNKLKVPVVAYGAGTSLEGQIVPGPRSGVVVDLSRMSAIVKIYPEASGFSGSTRALDKLCLRIKDMQAVVQAGISWNELNHELEPHGLFFTPDPG
ncbi:hypothetical protein HDU93_009546, partial [Gonapodya sp. JEL0774]